MMSEGTSRYWDAVAAARQQDRLGGLWRRHADAVNAALLERWLRPGPVGRILKTDVFDEAFGEGLYPVLAARAARVTGTDISRSVLAAAGERHPGLETVRADVRRLPFEDGSFDAVVSISTLDHFESRDEILTGLNELARVLRPGGQLLLTLDNLANPVILLRNALPLRWLMGLRVVPYYVGATCGPRGLVRLAQKAGLDVLETAAIMHCPRVLAVPLARRLARTGSGRAKERLLRALSACEKLAAWPTRFVTGHFVAIRAAKTE